MIDLLIIENKKDKNVDVFLSIFIIVSSIIKKFCNDMSIPKNWINKDYDETVEFLIKYIGPKDGQNAAIWEKIQPQLDQWKQQEDSINQQIKNEVQNTHKNAIDFSKPIFFLHHHRDGEQ